MAAINWLPKPINGNDDNGMEAPLKAVDIRDTLNHYGGKVTNDTTSYFTTDANINRWSKHKPFINRDPFLPFKSDAWDNQTGTIPMVYMHSNLQYEPALIEVWNGCSEDEWFQYELPNGSSDQPLRLGDFRGYRADATSPFKSFSSDSMEIEPINGTATFYLNMRYYLNDELAQADGGMLSLGDIAFQNNDYDYYMLLVAKFTPKNTIGGNTRYIAWKSDETIREANWGELVSSIDIGMINNTNEGTYEFAVGLTDNHSYHIKLPFPHVTLQAKIYHSNSFMGNISGNAEYHSQSQNSFVTASVDYTLGWETDGGEPVTGPKAIPIQFYIGSTEESALGPVMLGPAVTEIVEPGQTVTFTVTVNQSNYYPFDQQILPILKSCVDEGKVFVSANGQNAGEITLTSY